MKILISPDMGSAYRLDGETLEFAAMMQDGTFSTIDFSPVEPELVGDERCTFEGVETDLNGVFATVTARLYAGTIPALIEEYQNWCKAQDLPEMSADELLAQTTGDDVQIVYVANDEQRQWLRRFIARWEQAELELN